MADDAAQFFDACAKGDVDTVRRLLAIDPGLARAVDSKGYGGWTGLHSAAQRGHLDVVRLLLGHGADPNAREAGDNTSPLHWAAAHGHAGIARALLDAGSDVHGVGDVHELDTIGWATVFHGPNRARGDNPEVVSLLVERGARHHIFSAMSVGDLGLIRQVARDDPEGLNRRLSKFEQRQTPLHFALTLERHDILEVLLELGADLEAKDTYGLTPLESAMLAGNRDAARRLLAAGAKPPDTSARASSPQLLADRADSFQKVIPMILVPDVAAALAWYTSIGFTELERVADDGLVNWGLLQLGRAQLMLSMHGKTGPQSVSLWFYTDQVDDLYQRVKSRALESARAALDGTPPAEPAIEFVAHLYEPFYGGREFGIRDLNGYELFFRQG